ncbi:class I SAM-dependent methyltransferase [Paenibacillus albidus]|uniref:class I SAM-dependent methyltransferase n=1 Tax=Paenibacillus albidus TaxID=2041023 RepID=UPI00288B5C4C|nr:methyltransferase [Paenibacillus albidus]
MARRENSLSIQIPAFAGADRSITPSSGKLAAAMLKPIPWERTRAVAELGAGTGTITKHIRAAAGADTRVILFEKDPYLRRKLKGNFMNYTCYPDCSCLLHSLRQEGVQSLDCIISGLPFFNFPQEVRDRLIAEIVASLKEEGLFIAFQYSQQMKRQLNEHFDILDIRFVPMNLPPAFVYVCRKKGGRP